MLPLSYGSSRVLVQRGVANEFDDFVYSDHHILDGCLVFSGTFSSGRAGVGGTERANSITDDRTMYCPVDPNPDIFPTDRIVVFPPTVDTAPAEATPEGKAFRKLYGYQVTGLPMLWVHAMTGWAPGVEVPLEKVY